MRTWLPLVVAAVLAAPLAAQEDDGGNPDASGAVSGKEAGISEGAKDNVSAGTAETKTGPGSGGGKECKKGPAQQFGARYGGGNHNFLALIPGQAYYFPLRKEPVSGGISGTVTTGTSGNMTVEWAISRCPGDFEWYKTKKVEAFVPKKTDSAGKTARSGKGVLVTPCGQSTFVESNGVTWTTYEGPAPACPTDGEGPWYASVRSRGGCKTAKECTIVFDVIEQSAPPKK